MKPSHFAVPLFAAALAFGSPPAAQAGDALVGGIVGGIIGGVIVNEANKNRRVQRTTTRSSASSSQRAANREVQVALNYFGFPAGTPDGAIGPRSRAAIAGYQGHLGFPATGQLTQFERDFLVGSYHRAQAGGAATLQEVARYPDGARGLLVAWRDESIGGPRHGGVYAGLPREVAFAVDEIARNSNVEAGQLIQRSGFIQLADMNGDGRTDYLLDTSVTGSAFWCNAQACAVRVFASTPEGFQRNDFQAFNATPAMFSYQRGDCTLTGAPVMAAAPQPPAQPAPLMAAQPAQPVPSAQPVSPNPAAQAPALPTFLTAASPAPSLASHCNRTSLQTTGNGGFMTVASMTDPAFALAEQFCLARTYAMSQSEDMIAKVRGFTADQIAEQCRGLAPVLGPHIAAVSIKDAAPVLQDVSAFVIASGMAPAQLADTARICLGVGYRGDELQVALSAALLLAALGEQGYGELLGHHLALGFGTAARPDRALPWYDMSVDPAVAGTAMVFAPGMPDRAALIRKAAYTLAGRPDAVAQPQAAALPLFQMGPAASPAP